MKNIIFFCALTFVVISCTPARNISYFQYNGQQLNTLGRTNYDVRIKSKDLLSITVVSSEQEASRRYNLLTPQVEITTGYTQGQPMLQSYLVDEEGNINFPTLGILQVKGLTIRELSDLIEEQLKPFFSDELPIITVRILNYTVNVLGEVHRPGQVQTDNGRLTLLEVLSIAGDMTIYGKRDNVKVIREEADGNRIVYTLNLNDKSVFNSPAFFLEQNDVVYVEPNQSRANSSNYGAAETYRISTLSVLISLATMATTIFGLTR